MNTILEDLKFGVHLEKSDVTIKWHTTGDELKKLSNPIIKQEGGRIEYVWKGERLLSGIEGDWTASYNEYEIIQLFTSISLFYSGDNEAFNAYDRIKKHLLSLLGNPTVVNEKEDEKEIRWENDKYCISLYLFEMHAYRCRFNIALK